MKTIHLITTMLCCLASLSFSQDIISLSDVMITPTGSEKESFDTSLPVNLLELRDLEEKVATSVAEIFQNEPDELYQDHLSSVWQEFGLNDQPGRNIKLMAKARF